MSNPYFRGFANGTVAIVRGKFELVAAPEWQGRAIPSADGIRLWTPRWKVQPQEKRVNREFQLVLKANAVIA